MTDANLNAPDAEDDVVKEMYDARFPRVDAVKGPAHHMRFAVLKSLDAPPDPQGVAVTPPTSDGDTVVKSDTPAEPDAVTEPAAADEPIPAVKADEPDPEPDGDAEVPVEKAADGATLEDAAETAPELAEPAVKADDEEPDPAADAAMDAVAAPGSPAWEAADAEAATDVTGKLVELRRLVCELACREGIEVAAGDIDDAEGQWNLTQVNDALSFCLDIVARFAVDEQAEADTPVALDDVVADDQAGDGMSDPVTPDDDMQVDATVTGDMDDFMDAMKAAEAVAKAGRTISAANEAKIRAAITTLQGMVGDPVDEPEPEPAAADEPADDAPADPTEEAAVAKSDITEPEPVAEGDEPVTITKSELEQMLTDVVKAAVTPLEERVEKVEHQPATGGPLLNGAHLGQTLALRGQAATSDDSSELAAVTKQFEEATDPAEKAQLGRKVTLLRLTNGLTATR